MAYAGAPGPAPAMAPKAMSEVMPKEMTSADADAFVSDDSGCVPKPVPTKYEAFPDVSTPLKGQEHIATVT